MLRLLIISLGLIVLIPCVGNGEWGPAVLDVVIVLCLMVMGSGDREETRAYNNCVRYWADGRAGRDRRKVRQVSKKSYKRNQNRLYREIKRRIELENMPIPQSKIVKCERNVDTIAVEGMFQNDIVARHAETIRAEMARKISAQLLADGYIEFYSENTPEMMPVNSVTRIRARLNVVRPWN